MTAQPLSSWPTLTVEAAFGYSPLDTTLTWRDITAYVRWQLSTQRGKRKEDDQAQPGRMSLTLANTDRRFDPEYTASPYYATYLNLTGASGSYASTPDAAGIEITGDLGIVVLWEAPSSFTPAAPVTIASHYNATGNQRSAEFFLNSSGFLAFTYSTDGTATVTKTCSALLSTVTSPGTKLWVGVTHDVDNGAVGNDVKFWWAPYASLTLDTSTLAQLGTTQTTAGTVTRFNSTAAWVIGARDGNTQNLTAKVYQAQVHNNLTWSSTKMSPDFSIGLGSGATSVTDSQSNVWTVNSPATVTANTTIGTYVTPRTPIRFRATYSATTYDVWRGHVADWQPSYNKNFDATTTASCQDLMTVMAKVATGGAAWRSTVEALLPRAWWRFGETSITANSTTAVDQMGTYHGFYSGTDPTATTGLINDDDNGAFNTGTYGFAVLPPWGSGILSTDYVLIVCRFSTTSTNAHSTLWSIKWVFPDAAGDITWITSVYVNATGRVVADLTGGSTITSTNSGYNNGRGHTVAFYGSDILGWSLYVDGSDVGSGSGVGFLGPQYITNMWAGIYPDGTNPPTNTVIDDLVIFKGDPDNANFALGPTLIQDLHDAADDSWSGETTGARITRAAKVAAVPSGLRDVDTGQSTVEGWAGGTNTLSVSQSAELTEQGLLFVSGAGKLTFVDRPSLRNLTSSTTVTESKFVDYESDYSESWVVNEAVFTSTAGSGSSSDSTSITRYGRSSVSRTTIDDTQSNLAGGAQYLVTRYKDPKQRVTRLVIKADASGSTLWPQVLGREIGDRITFTRTPMGVGSAISQDLIIVGIEHSISESGWVTSWNLSQADTTSYFALDLTGHMLDSGALLAAF